MAMRLEPFLPACPHAEADALFVSFLVEIMRQQLDCCVSPRAIMEIEGHFRAA